MNTHSAGDGGIEPSLDEASVDSHGTQVMAESLVDNQPAAGCSAEGPPERTGEGGSADEVDGQLDNGDLTSEICGNPPVLGEKRTNAPVDSGGCGAGSRESEHKRTRPNEIGINVLNAASHDGLPHSSGHGGLGTAVVAHMGVAPSNSEQGDPRPSTPLAEAGPALLEGSTAVGEASPDDAVVLRSRRVARGGRNQEHTSALSRRGRRPHCGKAVCGSASTWAIGYCAWCQRNHVESDRLCAACHRPDTRFTHISPENLVSAKEWWKESRETRLPTAVKGAYEPTSDCLCFRDDCFYHLLRSAVRSSKRMKCGVCGQPERRRVGAPSTWRKVGAACDDMTKFFTVGAGSRRATLLATGENKTLDKNSMLRGACSGAYSADFRRRKSEEQRYMARVCGTPHTTKDRLVCRMTERVRAALLEGALVRGAEVEAWVVEYRKKENLPDVSATRVRTLVQFIMTKIGVLDNDATLVNLRGGASSEFDGRQSFKYLIPRNFSAEKIAKLDLMARTRGETVRHLEGRLMSLRKRFQDQQRLLGLQDSVGTTPVSPREREGAERGAGPVVSENTVPSANSENVR